MKIAVVTGANTGIGKEVARGLAGAGAHVVLACRSEARGEAARAEIVRELRSASVEVMRLDLASFGAIRSFARAFERRHGRLHVLVQNAAAMTLLRRETADGFERAFGVNFLGHFLLTSLLRGVLLASAPARIIVLTSVAHREGVLDLDDLPMARGFSSSAAYARSKLANLLFAYELAEQLRGTGVTVNAIHPGFVATARGPISQLARRIGSLFDRSVGPREGALPTLRLAIDAELAAVTGAYFEAAARAESSAASHDRALRKALWETAERAISRGAAGFHH